MPLTNKQKSIARAKILSTKIKNLVIAFIKLKADQEMQFSCVGKEAEARKLIQSMRVRLSRMRNIIRSRGLQLNNFKMRLKSITFDSDKSISIIILTKTTPAAEIEKDLGSIFDKLNN